MTPNKTSQYNTLILINFSVFLLTFCVAFDDFESLPGNFGPDRLVQNMEILHLAMAKVEKVKIAVLTLSVTPVQV